MDNHQKGRITKAVRDMTYQEQLEALAKDPRFKELVADIKTLSTERQDALSAEVAAMTD